MTVLEMAKMYYPRLWDKERLEQLVEAHKLTEKDMTAILQLAIHDKGE